MKIFKNKKKGILPGDKSAKIISGCILDVQCRFARVLQRVTRNWNTKQQGIFLICICAVSLLFSILAIVQPLVTESTSRIILLKPIVIPATLYRENKALQITETEFQQVEAFRRDHPEIMKARPGLYDSLLLVEQMYLSQQK